MNVELWIILRQDGMGHVTIAGSYNVENDPLPGLRQVLSNCDSEAMNRMIFFAVRIVEGVTVSLHHINALPSIDDTEEGRDGHSDAHCGGCRDGHCGGCRDGHCGGCRDGHESRSKHVCEARS